MAKPKNTYHHGDLRNALVLTAVRLIEDEGLDEFSLRAAAREVGVSANAAYRHFSDKSELLTAVAAHGFEQLAQRMRRTMNATRTGKTPAELAINRFKATGRAYVEFALAHPELFEVMFGRSGAHALAPRDPADDEVGTYALLGSALDDLVSTGVLTAARRPGAELKAWVTVHGFARLCLDGAVHLTSGCARASALESLLDFAVAGVRNSDS
ncbi:MAG: TetR/AcrR family transcriptional regulator [Mycobacterium sp.]|nr:TetR/AcrR family transcriptional regulator [Mycobacterium sp.]